MQVVEGRPVPPLNKGAVVAYVDNMVVASTSRECSIRVMEDIVITCKGAGLIVHEETYGAKDLETLGWEFSSANQTFRPKARRLWRLDGAIVFALAKGTCSG